nr:AMP-binding protein [Mycobacterium genavense]
MLGDAVHDNARRYPDRIAYRMGNQALTHAQLRDRAIALADVLADLGVRYQDRIAVMGRNSLGFGIVLAASQISGIILVTISFRSTSSEVADALGRVSPAIVFCDREFEPMITVAAAQAGIRRVITLDEPTLGSLGAAVPHVPVRRVPADGVACLLFTSDTTGAAKCCILGRGEMQAIALTMNAAMGSGCEDRVLINMPMFHIGAMAIVGGVYARGGTVILQRQFDTAEAVRLIRAEEVTILHMAPTMLQSLLDEASDDDELSSVRTVVYSAAPMAVSTLRRALEKMPRAGFLNLYGQTKAIVSVLPRELHSLDQDAAATLRSVGFPFPGVQVKIVDEFGCAVPDGVVGEVAVKSDMMFRGYLNDPDATRATLREGWCHTGDIGRFDQRGLLYLVDRKKDVIITGGENASSPDVEDVVSGVDGVAACAVVGAPDRRWGETVCAVVVLALGATVTLESLRRAVWSQLADYKVPRRLEIVNALPQLANGKIDKKLLRVQVARQGVPG